MAQNRPNRLFIFLKKSWLGLVNSIIKPSARAKIRWQVLFVLILAILAGSFDYPKLWDKGADLLNGELRRVPGPVISRIQIPFFYKKDFRLGLDLQGGAHLVYQADLSKVATSDRADAMQGVRDVVERRINALGVAEPVVQVAGADRLVVDLAGVLDVKEAIQKIGETPLLEFKEQNTAGPVPVTDAQKKEEADYNKAAQAKASQVLKQVQSGKVAFEDLVKQNSEDTQAIIDKGGDLGFINNTDSPEEFAEAVKLGVGKSSRTVLTTKLGLEIIRVDEKRATEKEVQASHILICYTGTSGCTQTRTKDEALKKIQDLKAQATPANFATLAKANSDDPTAKTNGGDLGFVKKGALVQPFEDVVFPQKVGTISDIVETEFGYHIIYKTAERPLVEYHLRRILIKTKTDADYQQPAEQFTNTGLTGSQLQKATVEFNQQTGDIMVSLQFNDEGRQLFKDITTKNLNKPVAIYLDGAPISIPTVQSVITDGQAVITGRFSLTEAKQLAQRLNAGALPVPISVISQQKVEASLGNDSLQASLIAGLYGFLAVAIFMILYYRLPGLVADVALVIYAGLVLALFKIIGVTMTLAGIAGFILSMGMAVDANILVFERMKEELKLGKTLGTAIDEGFKRAWPSIRDGHFTSLVGSLILFWFGASLIKGFGLTLSIGVVLSLFSSMNVTKSLIRLVAGWRVSKIDFLYLGKSKKV